MLLFEAKESISKRIKFYEHAAAFVTDESKSGLEALKIAEASIDAQIRLADMLNDWYATIKETDTLSANLCYEILEQIRFDYVEESKEWDD